MTEPERESRQDEWRQHHQVALLETEGPARGVERCLDEDREQRTHCERREGFLVPRARPPKRVRKPDQGARNQREAGRVGEQQRVGTEPVADRAGLDPEIRDARVVPEQPLRAEHRDQQDRRGIEPERQPVASPHGPHGPAVDHERRGQEHDRQEHVLDPREGGEPGQDREPDLQAAGRLGESADAEVDRPQHERIGDRVREHEGSEE